MNKFTFLSIIDAIYVMYMLNYFKTKYNFAHPLTYYSNKVFYHPIGKIDKPQSLICPFGNVAGFFLAGFIILRLVFITCNNKLSLFNYISRFILLLTFLLSFLNFNAVIYLIPHFIIEYFIIKYYLNK